MKALIADGNGSATVQNIDDPPVRDTYVKVKIHAIALNPTDYKHVFTYTKGGETIGIDGTGEVVDIGKDVKTKVKIGDRIAGMVHGCNSYSPRDGCFAEYAEFKDGIFAQIPDSWSWTQSAGLGAGVTTAGQGLFQSLGLPWPESGNKYRIPVLIYGGSTATGCLAIQYAHLAGLKVITLASPDQHARLRELGADVVHDIGAKIRKDSNDQLMHAFDIITNDSSMKICAEALADHPASDGTKPKVSLLLPGHTFPRDDVEVHLTSGYSVIGETSIKYGKEVTGEPADYEFGLKFWALTSRLIAEGIFHTHDVEVRNGGLSEVVASLHELKEGKVHNHKLVYPL